MESLQSQALPPVGTGPRTSIPLRSILNVDEGYDSAEKLQAGMSQSEPTVVKSDRTASQRSQFLFINTHSASRPTTRLRQDQKVINAHVQHTSHRQRRAAAIDRLKRKVRLCPQCAQSKPHGQFTDLERESSPSSSASESSPATPQVSEGTLRRPPQKGPHTAQYCGQCGAGLKVTGGDLSDQDISKKNIETPSPITSTLASPNDRSSSLTLFVVDQPTSLLDSGMLDPFATSSVALNMEMNGVLLHCKSQLQHVSLHISPDIFVKERLPLCHSPFRDRIRHTMDNSALVSICDGNLMLLTPYVCHPIFRSLLTRQSHTCYSRRDVPRS